MQRHRLLGADRRSVKPATPVGTAMPTQRRNSMSRHMARTGFWFHNIHYANHARISMRLCLALAGRFSDRAVAGGRRPRGLSAVRFGTRAPTSNTGDGLASGERRR